MQRQDRGTTIRNPSTAHLLIDSSDRTSGTSGNFIITKNNSIMNGFFHRMAVAEVVLDWCVDNVSAITGNNVFSIIVSGTPYSVTLPDESYTIAAALDELVILLNALAIGGNNFSIIAPGGAGGYAGSATLASTGTFTIVDTPLSQQLNLTTGVAATHFIVQCPALLPYTYIDFVSNELTNNQSLKDTTTNYFETNVLYRWYFAWDNPPLDDKYGYPIYQSYQRFIARRALPFPKQIRWENNIPVGQLSFQVYSSLGQLLTPSQTANGELEWKITLLVSED